MALPTLLSMPLLATNLLLDSLPEEELASLMACTEAVSLANRESLYEAGVRPKYAYFMTNGIASIVSNLSDGSTAEVGIIGREGLVGALHLLGHLDVPMQCFMQIAGSARRLPFAALEKLFISSAPMHACVLEFIQMGYLNASQLAACNALHTVEQRLARWLLVVQDRMQSDTYALTHEFLADMLVAHRPTVSVAAAALQKSGLISYRHGKVHILEREKLQSVACECYAISQKLLRHLYS
jgi:CRP-like cAMP-binding protein